jgi:hypothetical protein
VTKGSTRRQKRNTRNILTEFRSAPVYWCLGNNDVCWHRHWLRFGSLNVFWQILHHGLSLLAFERKTLFPDSDRSCDIPGLDIWATSLAQVNGLGMGHAVNRYVLKPPCTKSGIPVGTPHAFRHGRVSVLQQNGVPDDLIKRWVGHSSHKTTRKYSHLTREFRKEMASSLV